MRHSFLIVNAADLVPLLPPPSLTLGSASLTFRQVSDTATNFCVQTGSIGGNHSLLDTYLPYAAMLANGL